MYARQPSPNQQQKEDTSGRVKHPPVSNFMFWHDPDDWVVDGAGALKPTIVHITKRVGSGAVDKNGDFTPQRIWLEKRGWIGIPHEILGEGDDYIAAYVNTKGQLVCRTVFETGFRSVGGETDWAFDQEAWDTFVRLLRKRRTIPPPRPQIVMGLLEQQRQRLDFLGKRRPRTDDALAMERYEEQVTHAKTAIENLQTELGDAEGVYGRVEAPARASVLEALARAEAELAEEEEAVAAISKSRSKSRSKTAEAVE